MAGNNDIPQLMKMMEMIQSRIEESKKKIEIIVTTLQTLIKDIQRKMVRNIIMKNEKMKERDSQEMRKKKRRT